MKSSVEGIALGFMCSVVLAVYFVVMVYLGLHWWRN